MGREQFGRRVDDYLAKGMTVAEAIAATAQEAAKRRDPFLLMREAALGAGK